MRMHAVLLFANFNKRLPVLDWWAALERVRTAWGARPETIAVSDGEWLAHWRAGLDPASAVVAELHAVD